MALTAFSNSALLFNDGAEKAVISSIFYNSDKLEQIAFHVRADDFYNETHKLIFKAMVSLYEKRENIDPITVFEEVSKHISKTQLLIKKDLINLPDYLDSLSVYLPTDRTINVYAKIVKEQSVRRSILNVSKELNDYINDSTKTINEIVEESQQKILSIELDYSSKNLYHAKVIAERVHNEIYERSMKKKEANFGIPSGFRKVDSLIGGFRNSDFIIVGARPSIGKTAFALNIASAIALRKEGKKKVGFFSLEMTADALIKRIISSQSCIDSFKVQNSILSGQEIKSLNDVVNEISDSELYIEDTPNISLLTLATQARKLKRFYGIDIIFVDYISLISFETKNLPRHEQVASISKSLKELARELEIPIIALSQLTRDTEGREPNLASLRESGALEQDADIVILLHRDKDFKFESSDEIEPIETKVIVAKHRNGPTGRADILFLPHITKFVNKDHQY